MNSTSPQIERAIERAFKYLETEQQTDGAFPVRCLAHAGLPTAQSGIVHVLPIVMLLDILQSVPDAQASRISQQLIPWVARHLQQQNTDNFQHSDTYLLCYELALLLNAGEHIDNMIIANAVRHLVDNETVPGGPYYNARNPKKVPDLATNLAVARFLRHVAKPLPKLNAYLAETIPIGNSVYYLADWPLLSHLQALSAQTERPSPKKIMALLRIQHEDGSWPSEYICRDPYNNSCVIGAGALSTAHAIALLRSVTLKPAPAKTPHKKPPSYRSVTRAAEAIVRTHGVPVRRTLQLLIERIDQADTGREIGPLAARFSAALSASFPMPTRSVLQALGAGNLFAWVAYTIYDDLLDGDGKADLLPAANIAMRTAVHLFENAVPDNPDFTTLVRQTFDKIDSANAWETAHCWFVVQGSTIHIGRIPDYGNLHWLYERSLSHSLPVLGVLAAAGIPLHEDAGRHITRAFKDYLIIKQLSDDLHDWKEDLAAGHISYVVAKILSDMNIMPGPKQLPRLMELMERHFWEFTLPEISNQIIHRAKRAKHAIIKSDVVQRNNVLTNLIERIENSAQRTRTEQAEANLFAATFSKKPAA